MQTLTSIETLRHQIQAWRHNGQRIAFVPTMGNLHDGHLNLVQTAKQNADKVVVSIFVNPTQFGPHEDFARYPRTESADSLRLSECATDVLFLPTVETLYPQTSQTQVSVPEVANRLCGLHRPGHFDGVALVVCKLLNMVQPDILYLGEKDFQQLTVIRRMVNDLNIPTQVASVATVREADGLAMSSRNTYLSQEHRALAPVLYQTLIETREALLENANPSLLLTQRIQHLEQLGFVVDYLSLCRQQDLHEASAEDTDLVLLVAARLGSTRLIDNIRFER
jgi:pantoate--beta-alanine ligase